MVVDVPEWVGWVEGFTAPAQERASETLDRLLDATLELLEERSFRDISVEDICARADRSVGSFYARFDDKSGILRALYARVIATKRENRLRDLVDRADAARTETLANVVEVAALGIYLEYESPQPPRRDLVVESVRDPELLTLRNRGFAEGHAEWQQLVAPHLRDVDHPEPARAARVALDLVLAIADQELMLGPLGLPEGRDQWVQRQTEVALRAMGTDRSRRRVVPDVRFAARAAELADDPCNDTADELLDALQAELSATPYAKVTVRQVADVAGRHPTTFYAHFPNLAAAVGGLVVRQLRAASGAIDALLADPALRSARPSEAVERVVRETTAQCQRFESLEDKGAILLEDPTAADAWRAYHQRCAAALAQTFSARADASPRALPGAAFTALLALHDHRLFFGLDRAHLSGEAFIADVTDALLRILDLD